MKEISTDIKILFQHFERLHTEYNQSLEVEDYETHGEEDFREFVKQSLEIYWEDRKLSESQEFYNEKKEELRRKK